MSVLLMLVFGLAFIGWMETVFKKLDAEPRSVSKEKSFKASEDALRADEEEDALRQVYQDQDAEWHRQQQESHQQSDRDL